MNCPILIELEKLKKEVEILEKEKESLRNKIKELMQNLEAENER